MAQNNYYTFKQNSINGNILMNAQVFDEIVKKTVKQLDGVSLDTSIGIQIPGTKALVTCSIKDNVVYIRISVSIKYGFNISTDGIFGGVTINAVKQFQANNNLTQDGIVGKNTWNKLLNLNPQNVVLR